MLAEMSAEAQELKAAAGRLGDRCRGRVAGPAISAGRAGKAVGVGRGPGGWTCLRTFLHDWSLSRRGRDDWAARLELDREELDWQRANSHSQKENEFREWIQQPEIRREFLPEITRGISPETLRKIETELRLL